MGKKDLWNAVDLTQQTRGREKKEEEEELHACMHSTGMTSFGAASGHVPTLSPLTAIALQVDLITRPRAYESAVCRLIATMQLY